MISGIRKRMQTPEMELSCKTGNWRLLIGSSRSCRLRDISMSIPSGIMLKDRRDAFLNLYKLNVATLAKVSQRTGLAI